jgi:hypothetical protein
MRTTAGLIIDFKKQQPTWVPPHLVKEAVAIGAESVEGDVEVLEPEYVEKIAPTGDDRERAIFAVFDKLSIENKRDSFTAQGIPSTSALKELLDFEIPTKERVEMWQRYKEMKAST